MNLCTFFTPAYLINRDRDTDRLTTATKRSQSLGVPIERFPAISPPADASPSSNPNISPGLLACAASHRAVLSLIYDRGVERALIFEDDVVLRDDAVEWLERIIPQLNAVAWDVFYLGLHLMADGGMITENLGRVVRGHHTHAYAVTRAAIPKLIACIDRPPEKCRYTFDAYDDPELVKVYARPILAVQEPNWSHTLGGPANRLKQYFDVFDGDDFVSHCAEAQTWDFIARAQSAAAMAVSNILMAMPKYCDGPRPNFLNITDPTIFLLTFPPPLFVISQPRRWRGISFTRMGSSPCGGLSTSNVTHFRIREVYMSTLSARRSPLAIIRALREAKAKGLNPASDVSSRLALAEALEPRQLLTVTGASLGGPYPAAVECSSIQLFPAATTDHDPAPTYWKINFGDGTSTTATVAGSGTITHTYSEMGTYNAVAQVSDTSTGGSYYYCSNSVTVADAPILPYGGSYTTAISATEGVEYNGIVAHFTDGNPYKTASSFGATVNFGDGSSATGTITADPSGGFDVVATHTFTEGMSFNGTVAIHDNETASLSMSLYSTVAIPTVSVAASGDCSEDGRQPTYFTFSTSYALAESITIYFSLSGTATASLLATSSYTDGIATDGTGYTVDGATAPATSGGLWSATIGSGSTSAVVTATPLNDSVVEGDQTIIATVSAVTNFYAADGGGGATTQVARKDLVATAQLTTTSGPADVTAMNTAIGDLSNADSTVRDAASASLTQLVTQHPDLLASLITAKNDNDTPVGAQTLLTSIINTMQPYVDMVNAMPNVTAAANQLTVVIPGLGMPFDHVTIAIVPGLLPDGDAALTAPPWDGVAGHTLDTGVTTATINLVPLKKGTSTVEIVIKWWDADGNLLQRTERDISVTAN